VFATRRVAETIAALVNEIAGEEAACLIRKILNGEVIMIPFEEKARFLNC
jgi:hypothetical protein